MLFFAVWAALSTHQSSPLPIPVSQYIKLPSRDQGIAPSPVVNRGLPARLRIPTLKIDAAIGYVGLNKAGAMDVPANVVDVGWYKHGPLPGNTGSAVIAGHVNGPRGEAGVFSHLEALQPGDSISVADGQDQITLFTVREVRTYDQDEQPNEVFNSSEGAHLNLITCAGSWDTNQRHFLKRLVVFADRL